METYGEFLTRINSFEKCTIDFGNNDFAVSPSVSQKVNSPTVSPTTVNRLHTPS